MKYKINLIQEKERDFTGKIIYFALHYLRYILVVTQIVVIGVFFYRFKIDQEIIDLRDELQQKEEIVAVSDPLLSEAQAVDLKTREVKEIIGRQNIFSRMFAYILTVFPSSMRVTRLEMTESGITFEGITADPSIVKLLLDKLNSDKSFTKVELGSIRRVENNFYCPFKLSGFSLK